MVKTIKTLLLLGSLAVSPVLASAQGMGGGALVEKPNCRPTTIIGEQNPTPGQLYAYTHDYQTTNGEQFIWEIEGASQVDGNPANANGKTEIVKGGNKIDVIWDEERPTGKIKVTPATDCAGLAQIHGGLGGVIVLNKVLGVCPKAKIEGKDVVCAGESYKYNFNYEINGDYDGGHLWKFNGCENVSWTIQGAESVILYGYFLTVYNDALYCTTDSSYVDSLVVTYERTEVLVPNNIYTYSETTESTTWCLDNEITIYRTNVVRQIEVVWAENANDYELSVSANGCGISGFCGFQSASLPLIVSSPVTGLIGPSHLGCGSSNVYYQLEGGGGSSKSWEFSNPNWTWEPEIISIFPNNPNSPTFESTNSFYLNINGSGSGNVTLTSVDECGETTTVVETITVGTGTLTNMPSSIYMSGGTTNLCENQSVNLTAIGGSPSPDMRYQWELRKGVVVKQGLIDGLSISPILGDIDNVRVRFVTDCDYGPWTQLNLNVTKAPEPIENIIFTGSMCANEEYTIEALYGNSTHEGYQWNVDYSGSTTPIDPNTQNYIISGTVPLDADGQSVIVSVSASNSCGSTPIVTKTFTNFSGFSILPSVKLPTKYCGGTSNTFYVKENTRQDGVEYRWTFDPTNGDYIRENGFEMYEFTPDFGENAASNLYPKPGTVTEYDIKLEVKYGCGDWFPVYEEFGITPIYNGCNRASNASSIRRNDPVMNDGIFTIELLPNPAQDHVTIKFPDGGNIKNIRLIDAYGTERKNVNTISATEMLDISNLPLGVYTIIASENDKIAIEHLQVSP